MGFLIDNVEFVNTFLVVRGLSLHVILGNDFLQRTKAVINFRDKVIDLDGGDRLVRVKFEQILDRVRTCGVKILQKGVSENNIGTKVSACIEAEYMSESESEKSNINDAVWELRADEFCSEGEVVRSGQRAALWQVIVRYRGVFAEVPGRAREYECVLQIREHAPFMQLSLIHI